MEQVRFSGVSNERQSGGFNLIDGWIINRLKLSYISSFPLSVADCLVETNCDEYENIFFFRKITMKKKFFFFKKTGSFQIIISIHSVWLWCAHLQKKGRKKKKKKNVPNENGYIIVVCKENLNLFLVWMGG